MSRDSTYKQQEPLHGVTLERLLTELVERFGWEQLAVLIRINCFSHEPSLKSSLTFLRRTPWARKQVEVLYVEGVEGLRTYQHTSMTQASQPAVNKDSSQNPWAGSRWKQ